MSTSVTYVSCSVFRATSVYLVQQVVPMLPRRLCEDLCSLNPGSDRLAFSVEWLMDAEDGTIMEEEWFGRTVIRSCCKLSYDHAQEMLDDPTRDFSPSELPPVEAPWTPSDLARRVSALQQVAARLRARRTEGGAIRLDQPKLAFGTDKETGMPHVSDES